MTTEANWGIERNMVCFNSLDEVDAIHRVIDLLPAVGELLLGALQHVELEILRQPGVQPVCRACAMTAGGGRSRHTLTGRWYSLNEVLLVVLCVGDLPVAGERAEGLGDVGSGGGAPTEGGRGERGGRDERLLAVASGGRGARVGREV